MTLTEKDKVHEACAKAGVQFGSDSNRNYDYSVEVGDCKATRHYQDAMELVAFYGNDKL